MAVIVCTGLLFGCVCSASDVILPLWSTTEMGLSSGDWANLRSLRFAGVTVGVILLGGLSDRLGQRLLGALALAALAAVTFAFTSHNKTAIYILMPLLGTLVSTVLVTLNILTQMVSDRRQGIANVIYRSVMALAGIIAPVAVTSMAAAWGSYMWVFVILAAISLAAGVTLMAFPSVQRIYPYKGWRAEFGDLYRTYRVGFRQRKLVRYLNVSMIWLSGMNAVSVFAAIRLTQELGMGQKDFGWWCSVAAAAALVVTVASAVLMDRLSLRSLHVQLGLTGGAATAVMGLTNSPLLTAILMAATVANMALMSIPQAMWVSRCARRGTRAAAFNVQKVMAALYVAGTTAMLSVLEGWIGIRGAWLCCGILVVAGSLLFLMLPEPPPPPGRAKEVLESAELTEPV